MIRNRWIVSLTILGLQLSVSATQADNSGARVALHVKPHFVPSESVPTLCDYNPNEDGITCAQYTVTFPTNVVPGPHVFMVVGQADASVGVSGMSCGIEYSGSPGQGIDPVSFPVK